MSRIIQGTITRKIDGHQISIPFSIDTETGVYGQWGDDTMTIPYELIDAAIRLLSGDDRYSVKDNETGDWIA